MFTGIVQTVAEVTEVIRDGGTHALRLSSSLFEDLSNPAQVGDSVSVSGVCLTVMEHEGNRARFDVIGETARKTNLGLLSVGSRVNLERSLKLGDSLDGHIVQGHIDAVAELYSVTLESNNTYRLVVFHPEVVRGLIVPKGSVTLDGVSLTVGEVEEQNFSVYIIPHTFQATTLGAVRSGSCLNLEADCVARYVAGVSQVYLRSFTGRTTA